MYYHVANCRRKAFLKQAFSIFLIFTLYFNSFSSAHAATVGGWSLGGSIAQGASTVYNGTKQVIIDGTDYIKKGTAKITPTVSGVAKVLSRGAAAYALSIAVEQLLGAVDWVLDPANNRIVYHENPETTSEYRYENLEIYNGIGVRYVYTAAQAESAVRQFFSHVNRTNYTWGGCSRIDNNFQCKWGFEGEQPTRVINFYPVANPDYTQEDEEKSIPLETVAQKVITNAESGDTNAQVATTTAAADIVAEAESDNVKARPIVQQLEATATTTAADAAAAAQANTATGTQTQNPTVPEITDLTLEFPAFCGWAPLVCEAAQAAINFPQTVSNWWSKAVLSFTEAYAFAQAKVASLEDYFKDESNTSEETPEIINEIPLPELNTGTFQASAGCPPPISVPIDFGTQGEIQISYEPICQMAEKWSFVAPLIGFLSGAMILVGVGRKGEDGEI